MRVTAAGNRYWVNAGSIPLIFAADGKFISMAGKKGQGPNEIAGNALPIPLPGDSVLLIDFARQARGIVISPDLHFTRVITLPNGNLVGKPITWPTVVFMTGIVPTREMVGWPLHILDMQGSEARIERSGGHNGGEFRPGGPAVTGKVAIRGTELWTVEDARYRITRWDSNVKATRVLERRPSWWREPTINILGTRNTPPGPNTVGAAFDDEGLLWVVIRQPKRNWADAWNKVPKNASEIRSTQLSPSDLFDTLVEVIDVQAGRVVTRMLFDRYALVGELPARRVAFLSETTEGGQQVEIAALTIEKR